MGENKKIVETNQLESGLQRLGIRELEERLEVSSLVFGGQEANNFQPDQGVFNCGSYKEDDPLQLDKPVWPPFWV